MILQHQFTISYEVLGGYVKAVKAGKFKNDSGEIVDYGSSVRIICTNIIQNDTIDTDTGFANSFDRQLSFKISCPDDKEAGNLAIQLQKEIINKRPIYLEADLPVRRNDGSFEVSVIKVKNLSEKKSISK